MSNETTIDDIAMAEHGTSLWKDAWTRLKKNRLALFGLAVLTLFIIVALLTPWTLSSPVAPRVAFLTAFPQGLGNKHRQALPYLADMHGVVTLHM